MYRIPKRLMWFGLLCVLLVMPIALSNCAKKNAKIKDITINRENKKIEQVKSGEEVVIEAEVSKNPEDLTVTYKWEAEEGEIKTRDERKPMADYTAPATTEEKLVTVTLRALYGDKELDEKSIRIKVVLSPPPPDMVKITKPKNGETGLGSRVMVTGTANIPENLYLWIVVVPHASGMYFPQSFKAKSEPVGKGIKGSWRETAALGEENLGRGEQFDILAVVADEQAKSELSTKLEEWKIARSWPGLLQLPSGAEEKVRITVKRAE